MVDLMEDEERRVKKKTAVSGSGACSILPGSTGFSLKHDDEHQ